MSTEPLVDGHGRHFQCHGSVQALTRSGAPGAVLDALTDAGGPYRARGTCDVLVSVSGGTFEADFVLTPDGARALATALQLSADTAQAVAQALRDADAQGAS